MDDWKYDMSEWHRGWQSRFPENVREIVVEHRGECHRADILMGGYVIEFQHSPISAGEFERRKTIINEESAIVGIPIIVYDRPLHLHEPFATVVIMVFGKLQNDCYICGSLRNN